jgi:hypothetical protein
MKKKMEKEMKASASIDEAFKSIKTATGVTDVQEMVQKFLTREQTYSQLLVSISESEAKIDLLKRENENLRQRLNELQMAHEGDDEKMIPEEIRELQDELNLIHYNSE